MYRYILKRLLLMIPIVLGVSFIIFTIMNIIPGDPAILILGDGATEEAIAQLHEEMGYNDPFLVRYINYIIDAFFHFDLGESYMNHMSVADQIIDKLPVTVILAVGAVVFSIVIGVPMGILSAVKQYSLWDKIPTGLALFFAACPGFITGMILMLIFGLKLGWLPVNGITEGLKSYILPIIAIGVPNAARQLRFTRSSMLETIRQDYVRTARAKGAAEQKVIWGHALKNAILPVITVAGSNFGALLGGALATETLFGLPGIGSFIATAIKQKDVPVVMGGIIVFAIMFSIVMLLVDIAYAYADPRIKAKYAGRR